jgi:thiamine transport system permease protein
MIGTGWFILINPIADPVSLSLYVTAIVNALMALPFALRIIVPGIREALLSHGRLCLCLRLEAWAAWRWLLLPRCLPQIGFAAGLTGALSIGDLGVIALFADPDRTTLPLQMYRLMGAYQTEAAAGAALLLLAMALAIFWICDRGARRYAAV